MKTHFPTVSVEAARQRQHLPGFPIRPLVLIVDDEPLITETLAAILNANGMAPLTACNGEAALEIARIMPPELLISDISMPGMNGVDLAVQVSRLVPDCEVILFSGQAIPADARKGPRPSLGAEAQQFSVLLKPVHPADLLEHAWEKLKRRNTTIAAPKKRRTQSLYDFLSSVRLGTDAQPATWNVTMRQR